MYNLKYNLKGKTKYDWHLVADQMQVVCGPKVAPGPGV